MWNIFKENGSLAFIETFESLTEAELFLQTRIIEKVDEMPCFCDEEDIDALRDQYTIINLRGKCHDL